MALIEAFLAQGVQMLLVLLLAPLLLGLVRDAGVPHKVVSQGGQFQQSLPQGRVYHLLRLRLPQAHDFVPEISGHRLMVSIRLMRQDAEGRLKACSDDTSFELTLCS